MRPDPSRSKAKQPGVSYKAEAPVYGLHVNVRSTHTGTVIGVFYTEHRAGDEPLQGHAWHYEFSTDKTAAGLAHLSNLALWALRQCAAGKWRKKR